MRQRTKLATAIAHDPDFLLLDEPLTGVDPKARREFWDQIHRLAGEGITVLVSTHYMDEAARCDELVYIAYGKVLAHGSESEIVEQAGLAPGASLEEVFVKLIDRAQDNFAAPARPAKRAKEGRP